MPPRVLLGIDLGERDEPEDLFRLAHAANIACGGHAGNDASMRRAVERCVANGTIVGAHPSYPDREGFGRRRVAMKPEQVRACVREQCARLGAIAREAGAAVERVKAHGALYHAANAEAAEARAVVEGAVDAVGRRVTIVGRAQGALAAEAARAGVGFAREAFADRAARADGSLVPRGEPGALVTDPAAAAARARELAARGDVETICVHGDTPNAVAIARAVREALDDLARAVR